MQGLAAPCSQPARNVTDVHGCLYVAYVIEGPPLSLASQDGAHNLHPELHNADGCYAPLMDAVPRTARAGHHRRSQQPGAMGGVGLASRVQDLESDHRFLVRCASRCRRPSGRLYGAARLRSKDAQSNEIVMELAPLSRLYTCGRPRTTSPTPLAGWRTRGSSCQHCWRGSPAPWQRTARGSFLIRSDRLEGMR